MSIRTMLSRIGASWRLGVMDPGNLWGSNYKGTYELSGCQLSGFVTDQGQDKRFPPASVLITRSGIPYTSTNELTRSGNGWRFILEVPAPFTAEDVVHDLVRVFAVDHRGGRSELLIEGAVQLSYVRELMAPPSETELIIDFALGGNSLEYVGSGWSNPEPTHTWNDGKQATISLKFGVPGARYRVEALAFPFVVANALSQQTVQFSIGDKLIYTFNVDFGQKLLECDIPGDLTGNGHAALRLDFLDAVRPCDITGEKETRTVALAMRRLTLKRRLDTTISA
jgi:hypothetical protein